MAKSQKGGNALQLCSVENQKGVIDIKVGASGREITPRLNVVD